jgi:hypothetical protein
MNDITTNLELGVSRPAYLPSEVALVVAGAEADESESS